METVYKFSICIRFKLLTYYHYPPLDRQTKLKHGNNAEIMKTCFHINCQAVKYLFREFKYFFTIGVSHTVVLLSLLLLKFEKRLQKEY